MRGQLFFFIFLIMKQYIILKSHKYSILQNYIYFFQNLSKKLNINVSVFYKPCKRHTFSLLKSPHVNKKAKEHYGIKYFSCILMMNTYYNLSLIKKILKNKPNELMCKVILKN